MRHTKLMKIFLLLQYVFIRLKKYFIKNLNFDIFVKMLKIFATYDNCYRATFDELRQ